MSRLLRWLRPPSGCLVGCHRLVVPSTPTTCFNPIRCSRCGLVLDVSLGRFVPPS